MINLNIKAVGFLKLFQSKQALTKDLSRSNLCLDQLKTLIALLFCISPPLIYLIEMLIPELVFLSYKKLIVDSQNYQLLIHLSCNLLIEALPNFGEMVFLAINSTILNFS